MKKILIALLALLPMMALKATVLFDDTTNYPYTEGTIEGQGQWYCYYPSTPNMDAMVTNNLLYLSTSNKDEVGAPTNGWNNSTEYNFASFSLNVSQLPTSTNGSYFFQLQNDNDSNDCCHVFIDTRDTVVPGTYRLGIANFDTSFAALTPPVNFPLDLATGVTYTVVVLYDGNQNNLTFVGSTLWINPSEQDYQNVVNGDGTGTPGIGNGFVYGNDTTTSPNLLNLNVQQLGFSPYVNATIGNVKAADTFDEVNATNLPVFGIQPQSQTNYSGNSATFYAVASGVDVTYQWYSTSSGLLNESANFVGTTSNILTVNNLSATDHYYAVATDAYGNSVNSATATNSVDTDPTAVFFPPSVVAVNVTNNLFDNAGFTNQALGTGPISYQWYFAPTNTPNTYSPVDGQTNAVLKLFLSDYTLAGNYYVVASNSINSGSIAVGPTNNLTVIAPVLASLTQLHNYLLATTNQLVANKNSYYYITMNNLQVSGYVTTYGGFGSTYSEFFIQDAAGNGTEVYLGPGTGNTNTPPIGTYVTVSAELEVYHDGLELTTASLAAITTNTPAPVVPLSPKLANANFLDFATNGLGANALNSMGSLVTFTNVYLYGSASGGAFGTGGSHSGAGSVFPTNSYTILYFTVGAPYNVATGNTNTIEVYQFSYNYPGSGTVLITNPFCGAPIPTHCSQLTGAYYIYGGTPEILPSRLADYVTNTPPPFPVSVGLTAKGAPVINWTNNVGSTYSVYSTTDLNGSWTQAAYGLGYYPTNCTFTDTNKAAAKFYRVTSP